MRHSRAAAALLATALLAGCGRPLLSAQLEVPEVSITEPGQQFNQPFTNVLVPCSSPNLLPGCRAEVEQDIPFDIGSEVPFLDGEEGVTVELRLTGMGLHFPAGSATGLHEIRISLVGPGSATTLFASYTRPQGPPPTDVSLATDSSLNLADHLSEGVLALRVELTYDGDEGIPVEPVPTGPVSVDVTTTFSVKATVDYLKM
jgi:hypothetical protein